MSNDSSWRTTEEDVADLLTHDLDTTHVLHPFIDTANELVTDLLSNKGYSDRKLELIERWLSAHFYTVAKKAEIQSEHADGAGETYVMPQGGNNFSLTRYGQTAMMIETGGYLSALEKKIDSGRRIVGTGFPGRISPKSDLKSTETDMNMDIQS